ncbi:uncharacterized protein LOC114541054 [Dendronephthya gigantea]|uniref:uncharacterized protein LOC114541054 n=1 Tax=Dendronephthya gigantea TaxID=151771 RepID=UPI00106D78DD|nr:uncharacterized protein LOC114541054 [Dendronephthya gigantea]
MPSHARCAVGYCDNDKRYPDLYVKRSHVENLCFHKWPKDETTAELWRKQVLKSRQDDFNPKPGASGTFVCSNHFPLGKRTPNNPKTDFPSVFLNLSDYKTQSSPKKRRRINISTSEEPGEDTEMQQLEQHSGPESSDTIDSDFEPPSLMVPLRFEQLTRECDVKFYTGIPSTEAFHCIFEHLSPKALHMQYWRGTQQTQRESRPVSPFEEYASSVGVESRRGPPRKLRLEEEFLLTLRKLRLALMNLDLAFRFKISDGSVSSIFITWIKLMSKELAVLIIWPTRAQIKENLPKCFKALYPKVRCIIDCFECFTNTPSGLDLAATMWSEYKHHYTYKVLVAITPNGAISYVSPAYGGRATDVFIVRDSGFLNLVEPFDEIMADRGFKIREELMMHMATLCIPPSKAKSMQMLPSDVRKTSNIANVRIYVEQAIGRMKVFHILKNELPISMVPLADDIVRVCGALCNLLPPLCV